jgi:hypothetical protein
MLTVPSNDAVLAARSDELSLRPWLLGSKLWQETMMYNLEDLKVAQDV